MCSPSHFKERLGEVAVLISVCSPKYLLSEWCQRELNEFVQAAQAKGRARSRDEESGVQGDEDTRCL